MSRTTELMSSIRDRKAVPGRAVCAPIMWSDCEVIFVSWRPITRSKRRTIRLIVTKFNRPRTLDFIAGTAIHDDLAVDVYRNANVNGSTTDETVFDVLLILNGIVDDQFDRFAAVRTVYRYGRQHYEIT